MIIDYDHNPALTVDQKLQSLKESVQMALNELEMSNATSEQNDTDANLAKTIIEDYTGSTLAGSSQSVKSAIDTLDTTVESIDDYISGWASGSSYCKMPDGTLIQWGIESTASNANTTITLPTAFLNTSYSVVATDDYGALTGNFAIGQRTTTSFTIYRGVTTRLQWIAIGRWK